jgi:hypothetical protein
VTRENGLLRWCITCNCDGKTLSISSFQAHEATISPTPSIRWYSRFPSFYPLPLPAFVLPIFLLAAEELCRPFHEEQGWLGESVREFGGEPSSAAMEASLSGPETSARVGGGWPSQMVGTRGDEFRTCICLPRQVLSCRLYST